MARLKLEKYRLVQLWLDQGLEKYGLAQLCLDLGLEKIG